MALPTDPIKLAAYRARQAKNAANYRARQRATKAGLPVPPEIALQRAPNYRPPTVRGIVENAQASAMRQRMARAEVIGSLPDVRNPRVRLRPGEVTERMAPDRKTRAGRQRQATAIRERAAAERIQQVGRARRSQLREELVYGAQSDRLQDAMSRDQQREFQEYSARIASASQQALGILFLYAGGQNQYSAALERILASPESRDVEEGLGMLSVLADQADRADSMYSPRVIGRLTV